MKTWKRAGCPWFLWLLAPTAAAQTIAPGVTAIPGAVNGVVIEREGKRLAVYGDPSGEAPACEKVLFTGHRRDVVWAGRNLVERGAEAVAPEREKELFTGAAAFWKAHQTRRFHDYAQYSSKVAVRPFAKVTTVRGGDTIRWQDLTIRVLDTPGYTPGAVSYLIETGGKNIAFTGELIHDDGQLFDLYSLQDAIPAAKARGYHGYAARAGDLVASLRKLSEWKPDILIPSRGPIVRNPAKAMTKLRSRLETLFGSHFSTDALRWYWGDDNLRIRAAPVLGDRPIRWMSMAQTAMLPDWIIAIGNSRLIVSASKAAWLVDAGNPRLREALGRLRQQGKFDKLEGIYISHYHDDHADHAEELAQEFNCRIYASHELKDILENPSAYRMPCLTTNPLRSLNVWPEGVRRRWHEIEFESSYFPGQTFYHDALLVTKAGESYYFVGDSFTPSGIDDYCLLNRDFTGENLGFAYCLKKLRQLPVGTSLINQHVPPSFRFSRADLDLMEDALRRRHAVLKELFPWDDPNYGIDDLWARFYPYAVEATAGRATKLQFIVRNHSPKPQRYKVRLRLPEGWSGTPPAVQIAAPPKEERSASMTLTPACRASGLFVITADVAFDRWDLREWTEALVTVR